MHPPSSIVFEDQPNVSTMFRMNPSSFAASIAESNLIGVDVQITDARLAHTFLDMADATNIGENRSRRVDEAHTAYTSILHFLTRLTPTAEQDLVLTDLLRTLKMRLVAAGVVIG